MKRSSLLALVVLPLTLGAPTPASADEPLESAAEPPESAAKPVEKMTDGVYGRFDGDVDLSLAGGATFGPSGPDAAVLARGIFFQTAGIYGVYTDALGRSGAALPRSIGVGVTLRPLFIPRWAFDFQRGPAILDLTVDSIAFDLGLIWPAWTDGSFGERPGMEAALGFEVPLLGKASGPFVGTRGALRWRATEFAGHDDNGLKPALFVTLSWHTVVDANIVDVGDARLR